MEYPISKERRLFIPNHKEFELLSEQIISPSLLDEYVRNDMERSSASMG